MNKRGARGFGPNGAEEWLREVMVVVVVVVREGGTEAGFHYIGCYIEPASAGYGVGVWWEKGVCWAAKSLLMTLLHEHQLLIGI